MNEIDFLTRPERRNFKRLDISLDVDLMVEGKKLTTKTANISCGGLFISEDSWLEGRSPSSVRLSFSLPSQEQPLRLQGEVSRVQNPDSDPMTSGIAIQFKGLFDDNILALDKFIKDQLH